MPLRNLDLDSVVRGLIEGSEAAAKDVGTAAAAKIKACGLKADSGKAIRRVPVHTGRRNPRAGQKKGSGDFNLRSVLDWIDSIPTTIGADVAEDAPDAALINAENKAVKDAQDALIVVHATAVARAS